MDILCLCRSGFEKEVAAELTQLAAEQHVCGYVKTHVGTGLVRYVTDDAGMRVLLAQIPSRQLVFIRHWFVLLEEYTALDCEDRVSPLCERLLLGPPIAEVQALEVDTNAGKSLARLTRSIARHVSARLQQRGHGDTDADETAQVLFLAADHALLGLAKRDLLPPWAGGIARLRRPKYAPSRATLKLEEAWWHFIPKAQWASRVAPGMRAVDLGAAPGGWTWLLVSKSMFVDAVDNGPMDAQLLASGQVVHHQVDGFSYLPDKAVHWLVCDIADKPLRVARLVAAWGQRRLFAEAIFNLKLPMKQRYLTVMQAREQIVTALHEAGVAHRLHIKQLYYDRAEVTGHIQLLQ